MLYEEGMELKDVTCPCGCGYWDVFSEAFISGDQVRDGKESSRAAYEAKVKATLSPQEYEARLRRQFIEHFLDCEYKRKLDESDPANDGSTRRRAEAEVREIDDGDFTSRGRTVSRVDLPRPARSRGGGHLNTASRYPRDTDPVMSDARDTSREMIRGPADRNSRFISD